jgi:hypothetical protein
MALENISAMQVYIALAINGIFTGLGVAIGTYLAQKYFIERPKKFAERIRNRFKKKETGEINGQ